MNITPERALELAERFEAFAKGYAAIAASRSLTTSETLTQTHSSETAAILRHYSELLSRIENANPAELRWVLPDGIYNRPTSHDLLKAYKQADKTCHCETCVNQVKAEEILPKWEAVMNAELVEEFDAGLLNDYGGGNVGWWHDYIRAELSRAHDFYASQLIIKPKE